MNENNKILNLTQHATTPAQLREGIVDPPEEIKEKIKSLLTFSTPPSQEEMIERAKKLAQIAQSLGYDKVLIGGAPYFMSTLELVLSYYHISYFYSFSLRKVREETLPDGSVRKVSVFEHAGLVDTSRVMTGWYSDAWGPWASHIFDKMLEGGDEQ